jgi:hypothetical protein
VGVIIMLLKDITEVPPTETLLQFKKKCFADLSLQQQQAMQWCTVFQLYLCVFMRADVWKEVWKSFYALSHNVLVNATQFRQENIIDLDFVTTTCVSNFDLEAK